MKTCLLNYFILNDELRSSCDFNPLLLQENRGVYEVVRIIKQKPLFLEAHIARFFQSLKLEQLPGKLSLHQIKSRLKTLIEVNQLKTGNIRFQFAIHSQTGPLFLAWISPSFYPSPEEYSKGVRLVSLKAERENPNAKRDNLPVREQANQLLLQNDSFEALLVNQDGFVTEGSRSNIFFVDDDKVITPPLSAVLPGVTRSKVIQLADENGMEVIERPVLFSELGTFNAAFLSGTSLKVLPVNRIDKTRFINTSAPTTRLQKLYEKNMAQYLAGFSW